MKENLELERADIAIDRDMEVDCDIGQEITAYVETWFDVDRKFGTHTADDDSTWLNLYAKFNPFADTLRLECEIDTDRPEGNRYFDYEPTAAEARLIYGITMGIVHVKCRKCKLEEPLNLAYFRRIYRNQEQINPFHIGSIHR